MKKLRDEMFKIVECPKCDTYIIMPAEVDETKLECACHGKKLRIMFIGTREEIYDKYMWAV